MLWVFRSSTFWLAVFLIASAPSALSQQCPQNAHVDRVDITGEVRTVHCKCDDGYKNVGGTCERAGTTMRPTNPTIMRAQTRAECVRAAGNQLKADLAKCHSPIVECLKSAGVRPQEAICAASALVVAVDPSKVTVLGAAVACGDKIYEAADVCGATWGQCQNGPLQTYRQATAECPKN